MNLYHWSSRLLANYSNGDIIVMAENIEQARDKVYAQFNPLEDGNPFEDAYLQMLKLNGDTEGFTDELRTQRDRLTEDLNQEPTIVESGVVLIKGSD